MHPIVSVTVNPALDVSTAVDRVEPEHKLRCGPATVDPGGGGVNVARVVKRLGGRALALLALGGPTGEAYRRMLDAEGVLNRPVRIAGDTRQSFTVDERSTGDQFRFVLEGPSITPKEADSIEAALAEETGEGALVVLSGSLPPGTEPEFYARLTRRAAAQGARVVLDTSGPPLREALAAGVFVAKPNRRELRELTGEALATPEEEARAARGLVERGACEACMLTLGAAGALLATRDGVTRFAAPKVEPKSAVGAGDSFVGAVVAALAAGATIEAAFRRGVAAGSAALITPATELCRAEDVDRLEAELAAS